MFTKAPPARLEQRWSVWAAGYGGSQTTDGNAALGSNSTTSSVAGTAVGADYRLSPDTIAGFALAGGGTSFGVAGSGSGHSDLFQAGAFVRHNAGPAYITAALAYGWQDITTDRTVTWPVSISCGAIQRQRLIGPRRRRLSLRRAAGSAASASRLTPPLSSPRSICRPMPNRPSSAPTILRWPMAPRSVTDPRSELGFRTDKSFAMPDGVLTLRGRLAWAHDYDPTARSARPSRRCRARASSSTARRRPRTRC